MYIKLNTKDVEILKRGKINYLPEKDYSEDESDVLVDSIREKQIYYAQIEDTEAAEDFAEIADKIEQLMDEEY
ncbi:hypothetical protein [Allofustis seminis]|uniref:hypothetical protein n=1 Tax=Allofustis seminis TaxID=166939 RepID=UPI0003704A45|nr:hypothetical protein [Allofustis seminis]